jgi:ligand-binding SRPBCC domain-containing protein
MQTFSISIDVPAPMDRVWQVMSDVDRWHEWTPSITSVKRLGGAPLAVGARAMIRQPKFPPALWKVTDLQPGRSFTWVSAGPALRVVATHRVEATTTGSRATLSLDYSGFFGEMLARMTRDITNRYLRLEAAGLKARSENPNFRHSEAVR